MTKNERDWETIQYLRREIMRLRNEKEELVRDKGYLAETVNNLIFNQEQTINGLKMLCNEALNNIGAFVIWDK